MAHGLLLLARMRRALFGVLAATFALAGCAVSDGDDAATMNPNADLFRDFTDGKFDGAGHPLNARVTEAESLCGGSVTDGAVRVGSQCSGRIGGTEQQGPLVVSLHVRVDAGSAQGYAVSAYVRRETGEVLASVALTAAQLRSGWMDIPLTWDSDGTPALIQLVPAAGARVDFDYAELFPQRFGLVVSPGSGELSDSDTLTFELPKARSLDTVLLDGVDISSRLATLLSQGTATRTTTDYRTIVEVAVGDLAPERKATSELQLKSGALAARMQIRREAPPCVFEGDPNGVKVLVTGFQPFPADGWHENVSGIAVQAVNPAQLHGAQVMRLVMPVEYDRAAAEVTDAIARCAPAAVISFGQGGGEIALEQTAYNLQDTGEVAGGVPDNRGVIRAAAPIDPAAPSTRATLLPLDDIRRELESAGETPAFSTDPGRYICNNVMFADVGAMQARGGAGGFIHLPYTTQFDDATRTRFGNVVRIAVQATADALR